MTEFSLTDLKREVREFAKERDWDQFHSPKNLACALIVEAGELLEHFQWAESETATVSAEQKGHISEEIGDVLIYLVRLSDKLDVDPLDAARAKLRVNAEKYPVHLARGTSRKYTEF